MKYEGTKVYSVASTDHFPSSYQEFKLETDAITELGCGHGRPPGRGCPHCLGISTMYKNSDKIEAKIGVNAIGYLHVSSEELWSSEIFRIGTVFKCDGKPFEIVKSSKDPSTGLHCYKVVKKPR